MNTQMTSFVCFTLALIAIAFSQHNDIVPEEEHVPAVELPSIDLSTGTAPPSSHPKKASRLSKKDYAAFYQSAKEQVAQMMESGKSKKECKNAAKEMKTQVEKSVKAQQKTLDKMKRGKHCNTRGQKDINDASARLERRKQQVKAAQQALNKARKQTVNFGNFQYDQLMEGKCGSFFNQQVWKRAKKSVTKATDALNKAKTNQAAAEKALKQAKIDAAKEVRKCKCSTKKLLEKTQRDMNNTARKENTIAWTKGAHLKCVLEGKQNMSNCPVGTLPEVKSVALEKSVKEACYESWKSPKGFEILNAQNQKVKFTLYSLSERKGFVKNDAAQKKRYIKICKDEGMLPVGCNQHWSSWDCGKAQGRSQCASMPVQFSCNSIGGARSHTKFKGNLLGYFTNGNLYSGSYFYTSAGTPDQNRLYHPLCAKYGTANSHPKD